MKLLNRKSKAKKGFGIIVVLTFAAILAVFTAAIGAQTASNLHTVERQGQTDEAYYAALTGVHVTLGYLFDPPGSPFFDDEIQWLETDRSVRFNVGSHAIAAAHLYHNIAGFEGSRERANDGTAIPPDHFYITSVGEVNAEYDSAGELVGGRRVKQNTMGALIAPDFPTMPYAMFGYGEVNINGNVAHFHSGNARGSYSLSILDASGKPIPSGNHMDCAFPEASVASSRTDEGAIVLGDDAKIDGHALLGHASPALYSFASQPQFGSPPLVEPNPIPTFGSPPPDSWSGGSGHEKLTGVISRLGVDKGKRKVELPEGLEPLGSNPVFSYVQTLKGGVNYHVAGNLTVSSSGGFFVEQEDEDNPRDVVVYVDGNITFDGSQKINENSPPKWLKFYSLSNSGPSSFRMQSGAKAYCLVAGNVEDGREFTVTIDGNSELWGAVMGSNVHLKSGAIYYDTYLRDPKTVGSAYGFTIFSSSSLPHLAPDVSTALLAPPGGAPGTGGASTGTTGGGIGVATTGTTGTGGTTGTTGGTTGTEATGTTGGTTGTETTGTTAGTTGTTAGTTGTTAGTAGTTTGTAGTTGTTTGGTTGEVPQEPEPMPTTGGASTVGTTGTTGGTTGTTTGGGCGCGGGSMEVQEKQRLQDMN